MKYKTEEQAMEHVRLSERFINKTFDSFRDNKRVVLEAVGIKGYALNGASDKLKDDKQVVLKAVKNYGYAIQFASDRLKADKEVAYWALKENIGSTAFFHKSLLQEIGDLDPMKFLDSFMLKNTLEKSLTNNQDFKKQSGKI